MRFLSFIVALLAFAPAGQAKDFSSWRKFTKGELVAETTALAPGAAGTLGLHITLEKDWHTYWVNPGDSGAAVRLELKAPAGVKVKRALLPYPERVQVGPLISFAYSHETLFPFEVEVGPDVPVGQPLDFTLEAEWLVCSDVCIPAIDTLHLSVPVAPLADVKPGPLFALFQRTRAMIPQPQDELPEIRPEGSALRLELPASVSGEERELVDFFPFKNSGASNEPATVVSRSPLTLELKPGPVPRESRERVGVLVLRDKKSGAVTAHQYGDSGWRLQGAGVGAAGGGARDGLGWMLLWALLGGMILNLMPCVFPILSIKLLSLLKLSAAERGEVRRQNFAYVAGVLVSFVGIALLLAGLRSAGSLIGWGFQLQSPVFLSLLAWLFFLLALNLLGIFEIELLDAGMGGRLTRLGGWWGSFFTGVLAVVVASPCTAPFMGVALGFGLTQSWWILLAIFTALGLGLASPYLLFAIFPAWIRVLPRPGRWMNTLKQAMAFPLLLTLAWLLWILAQVRGPNAVFVVLAGCVLLGFAVWVSGGKRRLAWLLAVAFLGGGATYIYRSEQMAGSAVESDVWKPYSDDLLEKLKGQRVFVNMTADWCLTCKVNERLVFNDAEVRARLEAKKIVWVKGDWTQRNEQITRFLTRYDRVGVPFYVFFSEAHPAGLVLPEVLTKNTFLELIEKEFP